MRTRCAVTVLCLMLGPMISCGEAFAHGAEEHGNMKQSDAPMQKLHAMMPMFSTASEGLEAALDKGDAPAAEAEAGRILAAIPDLKKSQPHRNARQRKKYLELAKKEQEAVTATAELAKKGDFAGARIAFQRVEQACAACHAKFR
jgi:cytochrome c556